MQSITCYPTFVDLLGDRAKSNPDARAFVFLKDGETEQGSLTYQELDHRARAIAAYLLERANIGDRALLVYPYPAGLEFIEAFLGCLYAGIIAVPCHPPRNRQTIQDVSDRLISSGATVILTPKSTQAKLKQQLCSGDESSLARSSQWVITDQIPTSIATTWHSPTLSPETIAFLQYTSGSTGLPKGVMVTHRALLHNQQLLKLAFGHTEKLIGVGWLPLFHDMGLIGNVLQSLYVGTSCVLMSPLDFIQKPIRWLQAISTYKATTSGGPNFAYDLLCRYVTDDQLQHLDLTSWDVAFSGAEPVRPATLKQFAAKFSVCGFRYDAFYPCYGMAEAILFITGGKKAEPPQIRDVDVAALEQNQVVWSHSASTSETRPLVGCGHAWLDNQLLIVDPVTRQSCVANQVGEIWVSGSGLGSGYWQQPDKTEETFNAYLANSDNGPYLRTGDLGVVREGELFITGRLHDVLVFWGLNHYPHHIEHTVETCHPGFQVGSGAAFSIQVNGSDRLVVVQEVKPRYRNRLVVEDVVESIRWAVFDQHFIDVYAIVLAKPGRIPKTSSGKIQRQACRKLYLVGELDSLDEWRSPETRIQDIPMLMRRYLNPVTHIWRYWALAKRSLRSWLAKYKGMRHSDS